MKLFLSIIAVFGLQWAVAQNTKEQQYISAVVGFYNLENLFDTIDDPRIDDAEFLPNSAKKYNTAAYQRKLNYMATAIKGIGAEQNPDGLALLGVVEVENAAVLIDLAKTDSLVDRNYKVVHYQSPDARGIDVALLYNPKYFTEISSRPYNVTLPDKHPTRDILLVEGDLVGEKVYVLVNHWPSRRGGSNNFDLNNKERAYNRDARVNVDRVTGVQRQNQTEMDALKLDGEESSRPARVAAAKVCKAITDSIYALNANAKIIIMGDLNDDPNNVSLTQILETKDAAADVPVKGLYNALGGTFAKGYGSLAFNGKWNLFDQLIFSQPFLDQTQTKGWFFYSAHIYARDFLINQKGDYKGYPKRSWVGDRWNSGYSDHLPTYSLLVRVLGE